MENKLATVRPSEQAAVAQRAELYDRENLHKGPIHLSNEQLISIIDICFRQEFRADVAFGKGKVLLFVRRLDGTMAGVDFWFQTATNGIVANFTGSMIGGSWDFSVYKGCGQPKPAVSDDWGNNFRVSVKSLYEYLDKIDFFKELETEFLPNPIFANEGWQEIFSQNYAPQI